MKLFNRTDETSKQESIMYQKLYESYHNFQEFIIDKLYDMDNLGINESEKKLKTIDVLLPHWLGMYLKVKTSLPEVVSHIIELEKKYAIKCQNCDAFTHQATRYPKLNKGNF